MKLYCTREGVAVSEDQRWFRARDFSFDRLFTQEQPLEWLRRAQEPDGSWSAARWGGDRRFDVALTALPLLAFLFRRYWPRTESSLVRAVAG